MRSQLSALRVPTMLVSLVTALAMFSCAESPSISGFDPETAPTPDPEYAAEIDDWRERRNAGLSREYGWTSLVGLHWLDETETAFGSNPGPDGIAIPSSAKAEPPNVLINVSGYFTKFGDQVRMDTEPGVVAIVNDERSIQKMLRSDADADADNPPDDVYFGDVRLRLIKRGDRFAVRVWDPSAEARTNFHGVDVYAIDPRYRFESKLVRYDPPNEVQIATVVGTTIDGWTPGYVPFEILGTEYRIEPVIYDLESTSLSIMFSDETTGVETYGAGRYLSAQLEDGDKVVLDFNYAYNPPCAFTEFATCPLPPRENDLLVRIAAGERDYGDH